MCVSRIDGGPVKCIWEIHMPDKISGDSDGFQCRNPVVGISNHGEKLMAIRTENFGEITKENEVDIRKTRASISWLCRVVCTKSRCLRYNIWVNSNAPPIGADLQCKHRIDYDPESILDCIELPVEFRSDVATASVDTIKPEGGVAEISYEGHGYFFFFFRIAYRC